MTNLTTAIRESDPVFLDTAYLVALVNTRDAWHAAAVQWERHLAQRRRSLITTELILVELADALAAVRFRGSAVGIITTLRATDLVEIIPATSELVSEAFTMYARREDKDWGLTDCASFVVMQRQGIFDALTSDEHFTQAGFRALLLDEPT